MSSVEYGVHSRKFDPNELIPFFDEEACNTLTPTLWILTDKWDEDVNPFLSCFDQCWSRKRIPTHTVTVRFHFRAM